MKEELLVHYFANYLAFFRRQQFVWRAVHGLADGSTELSDAQLRACVDDVCEFMRQKLSINGVPLAVDEAAHLWLKGQLMKQVFGSSKAQWIKGR